MRRQTFPEVLAAQLFYMPSEICVRERQVVMTYLIKRNMINIENLIGLGGNVKIELTPDDLKMFAESVVERTIIAKDRLSEQSPPKEETYLNTKEARQLLGVCEGTLITWAKRGYLVPVKVGNKNRYAMSDIRRIQNGNRSETVTEYCKRNRRLNED